MSFFKKNISNSRKVSGTLLARQFYGIDIDDFLIKIVKISGRNLDNLKIDSIDIIDTPKNAVIDGRILNLDETVAVLQQINLTNSKLITHVPFPLLTHQKFKYSRDSNMSLVEAVEFEVSQISDVSEVNYDYYLSTANSNELENDVEVIVANKDDVDVRIALAESLQAELICLDTDVYARTNAVNHWMSTCAPERLNRVTVVVDVHESKTSVSILCNGEVLFHQSIAMGAQLLLSNLSRNSLDLNYKDLVSKTAQDLEHHTDAIKVFSKNLAGELKRLIQFYYTVMHDTDTASHTVDEILLTGGAFLENSTDIVQELLSINTSVVNFLEHYCQDIKKNDYCNDVDMHVLSTAFGLAMRGVL